MNEGLVETRLGSGTYVDKNVSIELTVELKEREEGYSDGKQLIKNKTPKTVLAK